MKAEITRRVGRSIVAAALMVLPLTTMAAVVGPVQGAATRRVPLPQQHIRASTPPLWRPARIGVHVFYGVIVAMNGPALRVRLRSGQFQDVDASQAIANGDYSEPLFVGKAVSVDGNVSGGRFIAAHVFRMPNLTGLRPDK